VEPAQTRRAALLALFAGAMAISFAPIFVRLSEVGPSATAFFRLLFALPFFWAWMWSDQSRKSVVRPTTRGDFALLAAAGLFFAGDMALWHWSLQFTSVANSTLLTNCAPFFVTLGAWVFLSERITRSFIVGMIVAFIGGAVLVSTRLEFRPHQVLGETLAVVTAVFYAGYLLTVKQLRTRFGTSTIMAWSGVASCVSLLIIALASNEAILPRSVFGWTVVAGLGIVSHLGGQSLIAYALGHLPASFSSVSLLLQPLIAAVLAWVLLKERLTLWQWMGGIIILCGIFVAGRKPVGTNGRVEPENRER
jgi:drug/metabolite transporter (DMT)-like permease